MSRTTSALSVALFALASGSPAFAVVLYDGSAGTTMSAQGWQFGAQPLFGHQTTVTAVGGATRLDTDAVRTDRAGFFSENPLLPILAHPAMPVLDSGTGYTVRFDLRILNEGHDTRDDNGDNVPDRAGFSVIAISESLAGLELGFWEDEVWAYAFDQPAPGVDHFLHGEGVALDTTAAMARYDLAVQGSGYRLYVDDVLRLTGGLRTYSPNSVSPDVYGIGSFLFFGDDTASADSVTDIFRVEVLPYAVPEPASAMVVIPIVCGVALRRARRPIESA